MDLCSPIKARRFTGRPRRRRQPLWTVAGLALSSVLGALVAGSPAFSLTATVPLQAPGTAPIGSVVVAGRDGTVAFAADEGTPYRSAAVRLSLVAPDGRVVLQQRFALPRGRYAGALTAAVDASGVASSAAHGATPPHV